MAISVKRCDGCRQLFETTDAAQFYCTPACRTARHRKLLGQDPDPVKNGQQRPEPQPVRSMFPGGNPYLEEFRNRPSTRPRGLREAFRIFAEATAGSDHDGDALARITRIRCGMPADPDTKKAK
jgi:hypothetical protein